MEELVHQARGVVQIADGDCNQERQGVSVGEEGRTAFQEVVDGRLSDSLFCLMEHQLMWHLMELLVL